MKKKKYKIFNITNKKQKNKFKKKKLLSVDYDLRLKELKRFGEEEDNNVEESIESIHVERRYRCFDCKMLFANSSLSESVRN